jgi:hypothetical protein
MSHKTASKARKERVAARRRASDRSQNLPSPHQYTFPLCETPFLRFMLDIARAQAAATHHLAMVAEYRHRAREAGR